MQEILLAGYSRSNSKFFTQRLNESGKFVSGELSSFTWQATYDVVFHFQMFNSNFVVIHKKDGVVYLQKMHEDGTLSSSSTLKIELGSFCPNLQVQELYGEFYLLGQNESNFFFIKRILDQGTRYENTYVERWGNFYPVINVVKVGEEL